MRQSAPSRRWLAGALALVGAAVYGFTAAGRYLSAPAQEPAAADLIVALGGGDTARNRKAAELFKRGFAPKVLLTGMEGNANQAHPRARHIISEGVPAEALLFDGNSTSTWGEAICTLQLMRERGMKRALIVSDPPHMRRLEWSWGKVFAGSGLQFRPVACDIPEWDASHWWRSKRFLQFVVREYAKMVYYRVAH